jgi:hypothetical protein
MRRPHTLEDTNDQTREKEKRKKESREIRPTHKTIPPRINKIVKKKEKRKSTHR